MNPLIIYSFPTSCNPPEEDYSSYIQNYSKSILHAMFMSPSMFTFMHDPSTEVHFLPSLDLLSLSGPTRSPYSHKSTAVLEPVRSSP